MSYESMAREEFGCDFPCCNDNFWIAPNAKVAVVKSGEVLAFCKSHCARLAEEGVQLRSLEEIHEVMKAPEKLRIEQERTKLERAFIESLKNKS